MKKIILFLILSFSLLSVKIKTHAQTYPDITVKATFEHVHLIRENTNTYQYTVIYRVNKDIFSRMDVSDYYLSTSVYIPLNRGYISEKNSYEITNATPLSTAPYALIHLRVTLLQSFVDTYYSNDPNSDFYIAKFFSNDSALYISYIGNTDSIDYDRGYEAGYQKGVTDGREEIRPIAYQDGEQAGYQKGYNDGKQDGYQKGYSDGFNEKFTLIIHVLIVPTIIIVFAIGIFVTYMIKKLKKQMIVK